MSGMVSHGKTNDISEYFKRGIARHQLNAYLNVYNSYSGQFMGSMGDISCHGFMLISPHPVMLVEEYELQLHLPQLDGDGETIVPFRAISRWCRPDLTPGHFDVDFSVSANQPIFAGLSIALKRYFTFVHQVDV
ncbi:MAG: PilZ domain-containing protein [Pseudomonas sp.]